MSDIEKQEKDRHLSIAEYFDILQLEYYICEIRKKIYAEIRDKDYWGYQMENKKKKIEDIAFRNSLKSIFNDDDVKKSYIKKVYPEMGLPNFNLNSKYKLTDNDITNYYRVDSDVRVHIGDGEDKIGKIVVVDLGHNYVVVKLRGESDKRKVLLKHVTRIL